MGSVHVRPGAPTAHLAAALAHTTAPVHPAAPVASATHAVRPLATDTGTFWDNSSAFSTQPIDQAGCSIFSSTGYYSSNCDPQAISPNVLTLGNGDVGVAYSLMTNSTPTGCSSGASVSSRVGFSLSSDGGQTFGSIAYLGNETCSYVDAVEPSFAVSSDGTVYGAYVEYNTSGNPGDFTDRSVTTALGFTKSTDDGATFSDPITISAINNIAKPQLAVFGQTVYVVYENISNGTNSVMFGLYGYYLDTPISESLLYSNDGGATWNGPFNLPGLNSSTYNVAFGAAIAVNKTGTVAVGYFTNHTCIAWAMYYPCWESGDELVLVTSTTNGSTWTTPLVIQSGVGETPYYPDSFYLSRFFQVAPQAQMIFDPTGQTAYITWAGTYNKTALAGLPWYPYSNYNSAGIWVATGAMAGTGWSVARAQVLLDPNNYDDLWNPSLGWSGGTLYLIFTWSNLTYCYSGNCPVLDGVFSEWLETSPDGITWSAPTFLSYSNTCSYGQCQTYNAGSSFGGYSSSVGFSATGTPLLAYALPGSPQTTYEYNNGTSYYNTTSPTTLAISQPWFGPTVAINFTEQNLTPGEQWQFSVDGQTYTTTDAWVNLTNVPYNQTVLLGAPPGVQIGYGAQATPVAGIPLAPKFTSDGTFWFNFTLSYLLNVAIEPTNPYYAELWFNDHFGNYYYYERYTNCPTCATTTYSNPPGEWYFTAGTQFQLNSSGQPTGFSYWTGSGTGSYTGSGLDANVTFNGPLNETGWVGGFSAYNLSVVATGLPSTSTIHFDLDGVPYSGPATSAVNLTNITTGAHELTNAWADSATSGWEYFGTAVPANPVIVPAETSVSLVFSYVNVASPVGTVTFQAQGLTTGTVWSFAFNGTTYSSSTPNIDIATRPGTFAVGAFPVVSANGSVGYTASGVGSTWSVSTGQTYTVGYVPAYKVDFSASTGGTVNNVASGSFWLASGATAQLTASAHSAYGFAGWTGTGLGSYTGTATTASITANGPIVETATFFPVPASRFNLSFTETGLAAGTWWTVFLGGVGYSSNQAAFAVHNLLSCSAPGGTYNLSIPYAYSSDGLTRFVPTSHLSRTICTNGATTVNEVFASQFELTLQATTGGYPTATIGLNTITTNAWVANGAVVTLGAFAQAGYTFLGWNGTGTGSFTGAGPNPSQTIVMIGPVTELASFAIVVQPTAPTFWVTFQVATTLAPGTAWTVNFGGVGYSSTGATLVVSGLAAGSYPLIVQGALSPDGLTRYTSLGNPAAVTVSHNQTVSVAYSTSYWVSVSATAGGTLHTQSGWVTSGGSILLNATANDGFVFVNWTCSAGPSCSSDVSTFTVRVTQPITEVASFAPSNTGGPTITTTSSSIWSQWTTWVGLAAVGLVIGLVVGLLVSRRSGRSPPSSSPPHSSDVSTEPEASEPSPADGGNQ